MFQIDGMAIQVVRKPIKNLNLAVYPPDGRVRISVPRHVTDDAIRALIKSRAGWIRKKQHQCRETMPAESFNYESGETHAVFGQACELTVIERRGKHRVIFDPSTTLQLYVRPGTARHRRKTLLDNWYREQLTPRIEELLVIWQPLIGKEVAGFGIKQMKTRWGSCNVQQRRIWLNLELARRPVACLEYVVVHEMVHLLERNHNKRFYQLMDQYLPDWQVSKALLNHRCLS